MRDRQRFGTQTGPGYVYAHARLLCHILSTPVDIEARPWNIEYSSSFQVGILLSRASHARDLAAGLLRCCSLSAAAVEVITSPHPPAALLPPSLPAACHYNSFAS